MSHPPRRRSRGTSPFRSAALLVLCGFIPSGVFGVLLSAQEITPKPTPPTAGSTTDPEPKPKETLSVEYLQQRKDAVAGGEAGLSPEQVTRATDLLDQAVMQVNAAQKAEERTAALQADVQTVPDRSQELQTAIDNESLVVPLSIDEATPKTEIDRLLQLKRAELATAERRTTELEQKRETRALRLRELPATKEALQKSLEGVRSSLELKAPPAEPAPITQANRLFLLAQEKALKAELALAAEESTAYAALEPLMALERKANEARVAKLKSQVNRLDTERQKLEQAERTQLAQQTAETARTSDPLLQDLAEANSQLAETRRGVTGLPARIERTRESIETRQNDLDDLEAEQRRIEEQLEIPNMERVIGPSLLRLRRDLKDVRTLKRFIAKRKETIYEARALQVEAKEELDRVPTVEEKLSEIEANASEPLGEIRSERIARELEPILQTRRALLTEQIDDTETYIAKLYELSGIEQRLVNRINEFSNLLDGHILWVRSTGAFGLADLNTIDDAFRWLFSPTNWARLIAGLVRDVTEAPLLWGFFAIATIGYWQLRRRLRARLRTLDHLVGSNRLLPSRYTLQAFAVNCLIAFMWPAFFLFIGWRLFGGETAGEFDRAVGAGLVMAAGYGFVLEALRRICRRGGLAELHFRWKQNDLRMMVSSLRWLILLALPAVFIVTAMQTQGDQRYIASAGRLALVLGLLLLTWMLYRSFSKFGIGTAARPQPKEIPQGDHIPAVAPAPRETLPLVWRIVRWLVILSPLALVGLSIAGFQYTALQLTDRLLMTVGLAVLLGIVKALVMRWLFVMRGTLALKQSSAAIASYDGDDDAERGKVMEARDGSQFILPAQQFDLAAINKQTRQILRIGLACAFFLGLVGIWYEVLPALTIFDLELWSTLDQTTITNPDTKLPETATTVRVIGLKHLVFAIIIVALSFVAARNIPGLLEVSVLQRLPLDLGGRDAVSTLVKYALVAIGIAVGTGMVGLHWSQVQWLVAALGVGIGFGMQEIFANFICGLILMFERPIRVGDIVTVADVTGIVTRIRIRATTVRDWDRKEFVVPNKELITGRLLNWTLTDPMNRVVMNIGVAYGSDTEKACTIIKQVLRDHPEVLQDPEPVVTFEGFGDSTLDIVVRCFLPTFEKRLPTIHDLHTRIDLAFRDADIEIAFPQRDLHLRSVTDQLPLPSTNGHPSNGEPHSNGTTGNGSAETPVPEATGSEKA